MLGRLYAKVRGEQPVPVQLVPEHRTAEFYARLAQGCAGDVLYDIRLSVVVKPGYEPWDMIWVLDCQPRSASGHKAVSLAWGTRMDRVELPVVVRQEIERVGLYEVFTHIMRLWRAVYTDHAEPGVLVSPRGPARTAE